MKYHWDTQEKNSYCKAEVRTLLKSLAEQIDEEVLRYRGNSAETTCEIFLKKHNLLEEDSKSKFFTVKRKISIP